MFEWVEPTAPYFVGSASGGQPYHMFDHSPNEFEPTGVCERVHRILVSAVHRTVGALDQGLLCRISVSLGLERFPNQYS